jgi:Na+-transporting NADH:ubiquinone oxidoreductase subunit NqrB
VNETAAQRSARIRRSYFRWPQRRDPRWVMIGIHSVFNILGQTVLGFAILPSQIACAVLCCSFWDMLFHRTFYGKWIVPKSGLITGLGMALLLRGPGFYPFLFAGTTAIASKHLFKIRGKHIWNPSTFGITLALLWVPGTTFISAQWGRSAAIVWVILNLGMLIMYRVRRVDVVVAFSAAYFGCWGIWALTNGFLFDSYGFWRTYNLAMTPAALIFTFFMITDPRTSPATRAGRMIYCVATAILAVWFTVNGQPGLFYGLFIVLCFVPLLDWLLVGRSLRSYLPWQGRHDTPQAAT